MRVAVVGAGMAGLRVSKRMQEMGADVHVFDKARGPSGRLATRRTDQGQFDHGAQYFTARSPVFGAQIDEWCRRGVVERWTGQVVRLENGSTVEEQGAPKRYVGAPRMSALARDLAVGLQTEFSTRIESARRDGKSWTLQSDIGVEYAEFDVVLLAVPAPQAVPLLEVSPDLARIARAVPMLPCHALMVRFQSELRVDFDAAFVGSSPLGWIARNASKPGRESEPTWVLHSTPEWSESNLDLDAESMRDVFLEAFAEAIGDWVPDARYFAAHRWLYARPERFASRAPLWDRELGLGACGDWVQGARVEDAFLSADVLADAIGDR